MFPHLIGKRFILSIAALLVIGGLALLTPHGLAPAAAGGISPAAPRLSANSPSGIFDLGTAFTYQGYLEVGDLPANGLYDFKFTLFYGAGMPATSELLVEDVQVSNGYFTTILDFGDVFTGNWLWLDIFAAPANSEDWIQLTPTDATRNIYAVPYAHSLRPGARVVAQNALTAITGQNDAATGLRGESMYGTGVYGYASASSGATYGVYGGVKSPQGYAGYFSGAVCVTDTLTVTAGVSVTGNLDVAGLISKGGGSFKIDHPLDPQNKYLYHSFVESPDMKNIYDGMVTLDENGEAWVQLPDWFEALNSDFRYQLTPIGAAMPGLYIAQEVQGNRFKIAGGLAGMKVSWQVTGIRHDPFADTYRIPVEQEKPAGQQGSYLYPEVYVPH